jgi:uncharacterized protein YndB with AHSA1/START domain
MNKNPETAPATELTMSREFDAPLALVWTVWTEPKHAMHWWGPHGFTTPVYEADLRPGGLVLVHMRAPDGTIFPNEGVIEEYVPHERIVTFGAVEIGGKLAFEARTTVTFAEHAGKTTITIHQVFSNIGPDAMNAIGGAPIGWAQQFERFTAYLTAQT